jgi:sirohydrochlorin cobaltochelatase
LRLPHERIAMVRNVVRQRVRDCVRTSFAGLALLLIVTAPARADDAGILLLAHGGSPEWNARVLDVARAVDRVQPVEVAFGMATRRTMQEALDRLNARGVGQIVAVPLFVSSWSSVITSSAFLLGLRADAPRELALYARMDHEQPKASPPGTASGGHEVPHPDGSTPVISRAPITRMTAALNAHPLVAQILVSRARAISRRPAEEAAVIVAHGPVSDEDNQRWLTDMKLLGAGVADAGGFASVDYVTLKDDAPAPVRDRATADLRALVASRAEEGKRVLIVPLLLSFGGIEKGIATRLEGLPYTMADAALMPDERVIQWVLEMAGDAAR